MRKFVIVAALAAVALSGAAACAKSASPTPTATTASAGAAADQTKEICAAALTEGVATATEFSTQADAVVQAAASGDTAKVQEVETKLRARLADWQAKLADWSTKNVKPEVKVALADAALTAKALSEAPVTATTIDTAKAKFTQIGTTVAAACA